MKTQLFALFCLFSVILFAEEQFDLDKWSSCYQKAEEQAKEELGNEFVMNRSDWECGKGVCFFVGGGMDNLQSTRWTQGYYMKFNPEGGLVKVAWWEDFPELVKFYNRRMKLAKQFQEEYAKSLGMTVEECEKEVDQGPLSPSSRLLGRRGMLAQRKEHEEKRKAEQEAEKKRQAEERAKMREELAALSEEVRQAREERERTALKAKEEKERKAKERENELCVKLQREMEQLTGYKLGTPIIEGNGTKIRSFTLYSGIEVQVFETKLAKPYRYMKDVRLTYWNSKLCYITMFVKFDKEYSNESIDEELEGMAKDLASKFQLGNPRKGCDRSVRWEQKSLSIALSNRDKELSLEFNDGQIKKDIENAAREMAYKRGRKLPKFEEAK